MPSIAHASSVSFRDHVASGNPKHGIAEGYVMDALKSDIKNLKANQMRMISLLEKTGAQGKHDSPEAPSSSPSFAIEAVLTSARDLATIQEASGHQLCSLPDHGVIICEVCNPNFDPSQDLKSPRVTGVLHYDFSGGTSFPKPSALPRQFVRLKAAIRSHIATAYHGRMEAAAQKEKSEKEARDKACNTVSIRVLRTGYHVIKESLSRELFEKLIVMQHINGLNVGGLCHSGSQMNRFRDAFASVILDSVARHVQETPCVSWIADKVTVNGRTLDITGLITLVPEAPASDLIQSVVIGAPVVREHDGTSLADEWIETAKRVGITEVRKLAAICTDGQYHHLKVPPKFLTKLTASHPDYAARSSPPCVPCLWDGAHLLDLADGSARAEPGCAWVKETVEAITRITKRFSIGKGRETLRTAGEEQGLPVRGLQLWSETRFSPYAARVLKNFIANIPILAAALKEQIDSASGKPSHTTELTSDLRLLTGKVCSVHVTAGCRNEMIVTLVGSFVGKMFPCLRLTDFILAFSVIFLVVG